MEVNRVATALVAIVITIVVIGTVAVPIVDEAVTGTSYKGTNTNYESRYTLLDSSPTFTFERASNGTMTLTQGGSTRTIGMDGNPAVLVSDTLAIRITSTAIVIWDIEHGTYVVNREMDMSLNITASSGTYTATMNFGDYSGTNTGSMNFALLKDPAGTWGVFTNQGFKTTVGQSYYIGSVYGYERFGPARLIEATGDRVGESIIEPMTTSGSTIVTAGRVTYDIDYTESEGNQKVGLVSGIASTWNTSEGGDPIGGGVITSVGDVRGEPTRAVTTVTEFHAWAPLEFKSTATGDAGTDGLLLSIIPVLLIIVAIMMAVRVLRGD